jgi:hypothetical protein
MPIIFPDTAEQDGRYSEGSHTRFSESYIIHTPSGLKARLRHLGLYSSETIGGVIEPDTALMSIMPISVWRYESVVSNKIRLSGLPILRVWRRLGDTYSIDDTKRLFNNLCDITLWG